MKACCAVVIGHVDHGKTALVRALTGIDTDSLAEEKARGLSITPGFAHCAYPEGIVDLIDAPGHQDFIPAMVSGATGAQVALLVVAADEGVAAQTREHLGIVELLGFRQALVVVTKSDLLDPEQWQTFSADLKATLASGSFAGAPVVHCSARTGVGLEDLHAALRQLLRSDTTERVGPTAPFLPIDRVFSVPGQGTVVTGTLLGADLSLEDECLLLPAGQEVRLRGLQSRGEARTRIGRGERAAVNLRGLPKSDVARGMVLSGAGGFGSSSIFDVKLTLQARASGPLRHMDQVRLLFGTASEVVRVSLFGARQIMPGEEGYALLRFAQPVAGFAGQVALVRRLSPVETLGGALVLDPLAKLARSNDAKRLKTLEEAAEGRLAGLVAALAQEGRGAFRLEDVARLARLSKTEAEDRIGGGTVQIASDLYAQAQEVERCKQQILQALAEQHAANPVRTYVKEQSLALQHVSPELVHYCLEALVQAQQLRRKDHGIALAQHDPLQNLQPAALAQLDEIEQAFRAGHLAPPKASDLVLDPLGEDLLDLLIEQDRLVGLTNVALRQVVILHAASLEEAQRRLLTAFGFKRSFRTGEAREVLGTSRRVVVPLLEYLDGKGLTRREGDLREFVRNMVV